MSIEPHAWMVTLPLTVALIQVYLLPPEHALKKMWRTVGEFEAMAWDRLGWGGAPLDLGRRPRSRRIVFVAVILGLSASTLASLGAFAGFA